MNVEYFDCVSRRLVEYLVRIPNKRDDANTRTLLDFFRALRPLADALQYGPESLLE
jgi:hypothetical protein